MTITAQAIAASYKLEECGAVEKLMAADGRRRAWIKGDSNTSNFSSNYLTAGWYDSSTPIGGLRGFYRGGLLNGSITPIEFANDNGETMTVSSTTYPWRSVNNPSAPGYGQLLGLSGVCLEGLQDYRKNTLAGSTLQHRFDFDPVGGGFYAIGATCCSPDWLKDDLTATFLWYEPANGVPATYTGGPGFIMQWRRDINFNNFQDTKTQVYPTPGAGATSVTGGTAGTIRFMTGVIPSTGPILISSITAAATPTITTTTPHNLLPGGKVVIVGSDASTGAGHTGNTVDGEYVVATAAAGSSTMTLTGFPNLSTGTAGTANGYVHQGATGRVEVAIKTNAAAASPKCYICVGCLVENNVVATGLSIVPLGNPEFRSTDWTDTTAISDAILTAWCAGINGGTARGAFDVIVYNLWHNMTTGTAADGSANDEAGTLAAGNTATVKANIKAVIARDRGIVGNVPVVLMMPYYFASWASGTYASVSASYTAYDTLAQALKEVCDEVGQCGMVNYYHNGGKREWSDSTNEGTNTVSGITNRHAALNGHRRAVSFFWQQVRTAYANITARSLTFRTSSRVSR